MVSKPEAAMGTGYYCATLPLYREGIRKKETKAFYDWAATGIPVIRL
jgi:hypothetical protein